MLDLAALNWWAILVATVAAFALGGLWYGPLFAKPWMEAIGKSAEELPTPPMPFVVSFFAALLTCVVMALLMQGLGIRTLGGGLAMGLAVGVGFIAASTASDAAHSGTGMRLWTITAGYRVVLSLIMGAILGAWT